LNVIACMRRSHAVPATTLPGSSIETKQEPCQTLTPGGRPHRRALEDVEARACGPVRTKGAESAYGIAKTASSVTRQINDHTAKAPGERISAVRVDPAPVGMVGRSSDSVDK
jgi:hypothetical protein